MKKDLYRRQTLLAINIRNIIEIVAINGIIDCRIFRNIIEIIDINDEK